MVLSAQHQVYILCIGYITESFNLYCLYPVINFLLLKYNIIDNINNAGYYSGLFMAIYSIAQIFSCGYIGKLGDIYGKKKVILIGMICSAVLYIMLGLSTNLYLILIIRFLTGLLCANNGLFKSFVGELSNQETEGRNFGLMMVSWSIGIILGTVIGGNTFELYFITYPILILCLITSCLYIFFSIMIYKYIEETINKKENNNAVYSFPLLDIFQYKNNTGVINAIIIYLCINMIDICMNEIMPLWMSLTINLKGMGYTSDKISYILSIAALGGILSQKVYIYLEQNTRRIYIFRISITIMALFIILIPYSSNFWMLSISNTLRFICSCWIWNIVYTIISSSADQGNKGHVNGITQSIGAVCDIFIPLITDPIFSTIAQTQKSTIIFSILGLFNIIPFCFTFYINTSIIDGNKENIIEPQQI